MAKYLLIITSFLFLQDLFAQGEAYYTAPMDIPLYLSGNFGEMRKNHFHTGIDIKTQGRQKIPVKAIADGYISRIKVSPYGYGNALYIDHLDGTTSVYAHLREFNDSIADYMRTKQYEAKNWALDYYLEAFEFEVFQGEIIGLSGNTGSSSGPHLHFEIRDTRSEHPLNPLRYGFKVKDDRRPEIKGVRVYPLSANSHVEMERVAKSYVALEDGSGKHIVKQKISAYGEVGLAIHTFDRMTGTNNKYGIYSLSMKVDGLEHYSHVMDELDFDNFRQVNCHKDYDLFHLNRWRYHKCFPSENNTLEIYDLLVDGGKIHLRPGDSFDVEFIVKDIDGNESQIAFELNCGEPLKTSAPLRDGVLMDASTDNIFTVDGLAVRIPHGRIYDDFYLRPSRKARPNGPSDLFYLNDRDIPLDDEIVISLQSRMPRSEWKYSILEHTDYRGRVNYIKGTMRDGWYEVRSKYLGAYRLVEDRVSPQISIEYSSKSWKLNLHLSDDISGVDTMSVEVNGNWLRMAHNASMSRAWGDMNEIELPSGRTDIRVYARDLAGNEVIEMRKVHLLK